MIFSSVVVLIAFKSQKLVPLFFVCIILYLFGCLCTGYYGIGIKIPFIVNFLKWDYATVFIRFLCRGLPFVSFGAIIHKYKNSIIKILPPRIELYVLIIFCCFVIEQYHQITIKRCS